MGVFCGNLVNKLGWKCVGIHRFISAISSNSSKIQMLTLGDFVYPIEALFGIRAPNHF
jgi:hypothetical protein